MHLKTSRKTKSPLRRRSLGTLIVLTVTLVVHLLPGSSYAQPSKKGAGPPPALVEVATVVEKRVVTRITLVGTAEPWLQTVVAAQEQGLVQKMLVEEGDKVKKGQVLCVQDADQLKLRIKAGKAALAEEAVLQAQAHREWERQKRLFAIQSVAEKAYQDAQSAVDASKNKLARLQAELLVLEDQLNKKKIVAPVSGYVIVRHCLVGQWLGEGDAAITLAVLDPIRATVLLPERYISSVKKGARAEVAFDAIPGRSFKGLIVAVIPRADEAARTFPVRIKIRNPKGEIMAGMLGRVTLPVGNPHRALLVPKDALVLSGSRASLFVVENQVARLVPVKHGAAHGALIEVEGDLRAGLKVVIRGNERLRQGQPVRIILKKPNKTENPKGEYRIANTSPSPLSGHETG